MDINTRLADVISSCRTEIQLDGAKRYTHLAHKSGLIGVKRLYFGYGVITTIRGLMRNKGVDQ